MDSEGGACGSAGIDCREEAGQRDWITHLLLASLTRILGRAKSSFKRWLCSINLRSLSSDIDCLALELMLAGCAGLWGVQR